MSTDTVLYALTTVQQRVNVSDDFDAGQKWDLRLSIDCCRSALLNESVEYFQNVVDQGLARYPDRYDFILEELFEQLGITNRDQLTALLTAA